MAKNTKIQWCDSTINPTMGCDGCELWSKTKKTCYAGILHGRFGGHTKGYAPTFDQVTNFPGRMADAASWSELRGKDRPNKPWLNGMPRLIFVSDMSDALSLSVSFEYLRDEIIENVISPKGQRHCWLWLTKRPQRMAEFGSWIADQGYVWPRNLWAGTSITDQKSTSRIKHLLKVGDAETIRFLSVEPQVEPIDFAPWIPQVDWLLHGGESGHGARAFKVEWAMELIEQCREFGVPFFLKQLGSVVEQNGERLKFKSAHASDWSKWEPDLAVREVPVPVV